MKFMDLLNRAVDKNDSLVCVGLDSELSKLPEAVKNSQTPMLDFNKAIVDATADLVCAYKPQAAYYEAQGPSGIEQLRQTVAYIHENYPDIPVILDAKRGDIGSTNDAYIKYIFEYLDVDAVTLHPYLGEESLKNFLEMADKGMIILCRTSNPGAGEFQDLTIDGQPLYQHVARQVSSSWNKHGNCLLVVGATYPEEMKEIREIVGPDLPFLVPGVGAQGGDATAAVKAGIGANRRGLIINSARGIIFASSGKDYADRAREEAEKLRAEIATALG
jgi:orotidine-5'-phosphate decarboxylase